MNQAATSGDIFRFGQFEADVARGTLTRNGVRVKIQDQPFRVLILLLERPAEIVTRSELKQRLWPEGTYVDFDGSLNVILKKLRAAIDDDPDNPRFIETVPRHGYRFIAPVAANRSSETTNPAGHPQHSPEVTAAPGPVPVIPAVQKPRSYLIYTLYAGLLVVVMASLWFVVRGKKAIPGASAAKVEGSVPLRRSVAVLGFRNVSGRGSDSWLGTAFSEMLSTELAGGDKLRLVPGEDVSNLRQTSPWSQTDTLDQATTARIGTALNTDLLVLGSYTTIGKQDGGQLRVDVRLQDARSGEILTEIAEIGGTEDLFQIVSRIGGKLRDRLGVPHLEVAEESGVLSSMPRDPIAAKFYALGLAKLREFDTSAAKDLLEQAITADPKFPLAHAMLARAWFDLGYEQKRREEAKKALELSNALPRAEKMLVEGDYYESLAKHDKAASIYHALFELFPDSVDYGLQLVFAKASSGHTSEAREVIRQLRTLPASLSTDPRIDIAEARLLVSKPDSLNLIHDALSKSWSQGKMLVYARARRDECMYLNYTAHPEQAEASCQEAYRIYLSAGNRLGAADSLRLLGDNQGTQGRFQAALASYNHALEVLDAMGGEHEKTGAILNNMAIVWENQGKLDKSEQLYLKAKSNFEQAGDKFNVLTTLANLADVNFLRGDLAQADKLYEQGLRASAALDPNSPGYLLYRSADLALAQGRVHDAHSRVDEAIKTISSEQGNYQGLTSAMIVLGEVLEAEGNLEGAQEQFEKALAIQKKMGAMDLADESQEEIAALNILQRRPEKAEPILRTLIADFEKENAAPDASSAYTLLSRALLMEGKTDEAAKAIAKASELSLTSSDPALTLPAAIQRARLAGAGHGNPIAGARQELRSTIALARKLGYYNLEGEARLALAQMEWKTTPGPARAQLTSLATEARSRGLELLAHQAEQALAEQSNEVAANASH